MAADPILVETFKTGTLTEKATALARTVISQQTAKLTPVQKKKFEEECINIVNLSKYKRVFKFIELATVAFNKARENLL